MNICLLIHLACADGNTVQAACVPPGQVYSLQSEAQLHGVCSVDYHV